MDLHVDVPLRRLQKATCYLIPFKLYEKNRQHQLLINYQKTEGNRNDDEDESHYKKRSIKAKRIDREHRRNFRFEQYKYAKKYNQLIAKLDRGQKKKTQERIFQNISEISEGNETKTDSECQKKCKPKSVTMCPHKKFFSPHVRQRRLEHELLRLVRMKTKSLALTNV